MNPITAEEFSRLVQREDLLGLNVMLIQGRLPKVGFDAFGLNEFHRIIFACRESTIRYLAAVVKTDVMSNSNKVACYIVQIFACKLERTFLLKNLIKHYNKSWRQVRTLAMLIAWVQDELIDRMSKVCKFGRYHPIVAYTMLTNGTPREQVTKFTLLPPFDPNDSIFLKKCMQLEPPYMEIFSHPKLNAELAKKVLTDREDDTN